MVLYIIVFFIFYTNKTLKLLKLGVISLIVNNILKNIIRRDRPYVSYSDILGKYIESGTGFSFPSGHAQLMATFLIYIYLSTRLIFIKICCLLALLAVCISRMFWITFLYRYLGWSIYRFMYKSFI
ncbi:MAG: phosphatase PAP2 family protein [Cetobacterium sp.]|uniref:phosphatase PAP2 family protein n=1 Tax=Cetobacterium sp. TaxID=2071632 RepID=UPI003EE646BB